MNHDSACRVRVRVRVLVRVRVRVRVWFGARKTLRQKKKRTLRPTLL